MHEKNCSIFTKHELHGEFQCHKVVNFLFCSETVHVIQKVSLTFLLMYMVIMQIVVVFQSLSRVTVLSKCQNQATLDIKTRVCSEKSVIRSTLPQENRTKIVLIVLHLLKRHLTIFLPLLLFRKPLSICKQRWFLFTNVLVWLGMIFLLLQLYVYVFKTSYQIFRFFSLLSCFKMNILQAQFH